VHSIITPFFSEFQAINAKMSTKKYDASIAAPPTPGADPLKLSSPVSDHPVPSLRIELTDEKKVLAGFIPSNEPAATTLETFILQQDNELEDKFQEEVWDAYLKNEADDSDIEAMSIYNVKDFKPTHPKVWSWQKPPA
jgi:hypothetical protein